MVVEIVTLQYPRCLISSDLKFAGPGFLASGTYEQDVANLLEQDNIHLQPPSAQLA
jgi:hypothetical protein